MVRVIADAAILWFLGTMLITMRYLLQLLLEAVDRSIYSLIVIIYGPIAADNPRNVVMAPINRVIHHQLLSLCWFADCEGERAPNTHFTNQFVIYRVQSGRMIPDFTVADSYFTVGVGAPHHNLGVLVDNDDEGATNVHALNLDIVLQFDFARPLELSENAGAPDIHDSLLCNCSTSMPS